MLKIRPLLGSATTTDPFRGPSASTAAARTAASSPVRSSPSTELPRDARSTTSFQFTRGRRASAAAVDVRTGLFTETPVVDRAVAALCVAALATGLLTVVLEAVLLAVVFFLVGVVWV